MKKRLFTGIQSSGDLHIGNYFGALKPFLDLGLKKVLDIETAKNLAKLANKNKIIGTLGAAFVAKALTKGFASGTLAKLGPIRIKA